MKTLNDYIELIETISRIEYNRLSTSSHLIDFSELVNIGAIAVHVLISSNKDAEYNISYMSTAIKWAIRNELRRRYKWYALKSSAKDDHEEMVSASEDNLEIEKSKLRESVYEQILSIEDLEEAENPTQIKDNALNPEESLEFRELNKAIKEAMKVLLPREKMVIEHRFFKGRKIKDLAEEMNISSSRVSRIMQSGLDKIRNELRKKDMMFD